MLCFAYLLLVVCSWVGEGVNDVSSPHLRLIFLFSNVSILGYDDNVIVKHMFDNVLPTTLSKQKDTLRETIKKYSYCFQVSSLFIHPKTVK